MNSKATTRELTAELRAVRLEREATARNPKGIRINKD